MVLFHCFISVWSSLLVEKAYNYLTENQTSHCGYWQLHSHLSPVVLFPGPTFWSSSSYTPSAGRVLQFSFLNIVYIQSWHFLHPVGTESLRHFLNVLGWHCALSQCSLCQLGCQSGRKPLAVPQLIVWAEGFRLWDELEPYPGTPNSTRKV